MTGRKVVINAIESAGGNAEAILAAISEVGYVCVPCTPTPEMLRAAWADALAEDAGGVWSSMIEENEKRTD